MKSFQKRVAVWLKRCFTQSIIENKEERNHRFIEESLELVQSCGYTKEQAHAMVDYVFNRPLGEIHQEVGGTMVTLAALCEVNGFNMEDEAERELARIDTVEITNKIREKQNSKPEHIKND